MRIADIASAPVYVTNPEQPLAVAAHEMRARGVGALVVSIRMLLGQGP